MYLLQIYRCFTVVLMILEGPTSYSDRLIKFFFLQRGEHANCVPPYCMSPLSGSQWKATGNRPIFNFIRMDCCLIYHNSQSGLHHRCNLKAVFSVSSIIDHQLRLYYIGLDILVIIDVTIIIGRCDIKAFYLLNNVMSDWPVLLCLKLSNQLILLSLMTSWFVIIDIGGLLF